MKTNTPIKVVGISTITTNEAAQNQNTIGNLWDDFLKMPIKEKLSDIISPSVFAVYSEYENGYQGKFKITIGYAVNDTSNTPNDLTTVTIPTGNYKTYKAKSRAVEDIVDTWKTIWQVDPHLFPRSFVADFEEYNENEVAINIGYK